MTTHHNMRRKVTIAYHKRVTISSQTYSSLRHGKCGFVFNSRSYRTTRATYLRAKRIEMTWRGRVSVAWKAYLRMKSIRIRQQHRCHCSTKAALERVWRIVTNKKRKARQTKAYAKCKMMQCVLKGTKLTSGVCKGVLKIVRKKTLYHVTRRTNCSRHAYKRAGAQPQHRLGEEAGHQERRPLKHQGAQRQVRHPLRASQVQGKALEDLRRRSCQVLCAPQEWWYPRQLERQSVIHQGHLRQPSRLSREEVQGHAREERQA